MNKQTQPLVSVVMCIYNGEKYLQKQIDSVLSQNYTNFELLCLDDVSTDNSVAILKAYQQQDARVKIFLNNANLGFNKNFEKGISLCSGEYISICDQDDIWLPNKIERLISNIGNNVLIYSNSDLMNEHDQELGKRLDHKVRHIDKPSYKAFLEGNFITGHTCLFKKELIQHILPFPESLVYYDWWISSIAAYIGEIKYLDEVLTKYRIHASSVIQQEKGISTKSLKRRSIKHNQLKAFMDKEFISPKDREFIAHYLSLKIRAGKGPIGLAKCYLYLSKNFDEICPWYFKPYYKRINFIRKSCS